jgi:predicted phosphate transport protein (TIGR00153 family)
MLFGGGKDKQFFALLNEAAQTISETAKVFDAMVQNLERSGEYAEKLYKLEKQGDRITHDVILLLNKLFITPLEREDILELAMQLDGVVDGIEAAAARLHLYKVKGSNHVLREFASVINQQAAELGTAMQRLAAKQLQPMRENTVRINELENQGDKILRDALEKLFEHETNPIQIIKLKEIYETLEEVTDRAEDVADVLESVIMKHS